MQRPRMKPVRIINTCVSLTIKAPKTSIQVVHSISLYTAGLQMQIKSLTSLPKSWPFRATDAGNYTLLAASGTTCPIFIRASALGPVLLPRRGKIGRERLGWAEPHLDLQNWLLHEAMNSPDLRQLEA